MGCLHGEEGLPIIMVMVMAMVIVMVIGRLWGMLVRCRVLGLRMLGMGMGRAWRLSGGLSLWGGLKCPEFIYHIIWLAILLIVCFVIELQVLKY